MTQRTVIKRKIQLTSAAIALLVAGGCFSGNSQEGNPDKTADGGDTTEPGGPQILDFSVNSSLINETQSLTFTAVVTDADGIDDIIGGTLKSPSGASYGAFATSAAEGAYSITLDWSALNAVDEIVFRDAESTQLTFVAEFFDQSGKTATASASAGLECSVEGSRVCGEAVCEPMTSYESCGQCDNSCDSFWAETMAGDDVQGLRVTLSNKIGCLVQDQKCTGGMRLETNETFTNNLSCDDACGNWACVGASSGLGEPRSCSASVESISQGGYVYLDCECVAP